MIETLAKLFVFLAAIFLIVLAIGSFVLPKRIALFLDSFASTARLHFTEMFVRLVIGFALVRVASDMAYSGFFQIFGWVLIISSIGLMLIPWQYHKKIASVVVPPLTKRVWQLLFHSLPEWPDKMAKLTLLFQDTRGVLAT